MDNLIEINDLTIDYGNGKGIFDFNINIKKGEVVAIVGSNGAGKSTTMRALMGFLSPNKGSITIDSLDSWKNSKDVKKEVSYLPGEINFPDVGSGETFLKLLRGYYSIKDETYMDKLISLFALDVRVPLRRMSKGMKQKVALVAAFMKDSPIILLDEPSTGLDPLMRDNLINLINEEKSKGKTIIMSSHVFKEIEDTARRVIFIDKGHIIDDVEMNDIYDNGVKEYKIGFKDLSDRENMIKNTKLNVSYISNNTNDIRVLLDDTMSNELFQELKQYNIESLEYIPYTIETYYERNILGGNINE